MNDLDELKSLLFGAEKQTLDSIAARVEKRETRAVDVADILPEAINTSHRKNAELVDALKDPVGRCLQESFREQPEFYGDALYPVMGPAIRKSIMHALRTLTQQVNSTMEQSLSATGIQWRFQAWRSGVPFGEFVLQKTLQYRVEQAYLMSRENGLLIGHVHHEVATIKDSDAVSAMFTAIQDFVKESFSPDRTGRLETADMGEFTLWAVHGPHALLVCVIRGVPPKSLRGDLSAILERVHFRYGDPIRNYAGDTASVQGIEEELQACIRFEAQRETEKGGKRVSLPLMIILVILVGLVVGIAASQWFQIQDYRRFSDALAETPGLYVGALERDGSEFRLRGMRDPLAASVADVARTAEIDMSRVDADLGTFQSLDPEIVLRRAERILDVPAGIELTLSGTVLTATGPVSMGWRQGVNDRLVAIPGVDDLVVAHSDADRAEMVRRYLEAPATTDVSMVNDVIRITGAAPQSWIVASREKLSDPAFTEQVILDGLVSAEWLALEILISNIDSEPIRFSKDWTLTDESAITLQDRAEQLGDYFEQASSVGAGLVITLKGHTDGVGSNEANADLSAGRSAVVMAALIGEGVPESAIVVVRDVADSNSIDLSMRRVDISVSLSPPIIE